MINQTRTRLKLLLGTLAAAVALSAVGAAPPDPVDTGVPLGGEALMKGEAQKPAAKRLQWWSEARFGMFIHWGLYAQDGCFFKGKDGTSEHMMRHLQIPIAEYEKITSDFNPVKFNADEWVRIAKAAGMKYMIITAKPSDAKLVVPGLKNAVASATLLANGDKLAAATNPNGLVITLPATAPDKISSTIVLKVRGALEVD